MIESNLKTEAALAATVTLASVAASAAEAPPLDELIAKIKDKDDKIRGPAWQSAGPAGAQAVKPLAAVMADSDMEVARAAKRALWKVVRYAGRPNADQERRAVARELVELLQGQPVPVQREALWMLSEIGQGDAVKAIVPHLTNQALREDARAALERIPGEQSLAALKKALTTVPEEFRPAIAQSLRVRGVKVSEYPSQKLVPTRPAPAGAAKTA